MMIGQRPEFKMYVIKLNLHKLKSKYQVQNRDLSKIQHQPILEVYQFAAIPSSDSIEKTSPFSVSLPGEPLRQPLWTRPVCSILPPSPFKIIFLCLASEGFAVWYATCLSRCLLSIPSAEAPMGTTLTFGLFPPMLGVSFHLSPIVHCLPQNDHRHKLSWFQNPLKPLLQEAFLKFCCLCWSHSPQRSSCTHSWHFAI